MHEFLLTAAHPWAFYKWEVCTVWLGLLIFFIEALWVEFVRIWVILRIVMQSEDRNVNSGPFPKHYSSRKSKELDNQRCTSILEMV
jgi:hypothetical protein